MIYNNLSQSKDLYLFKDKKLIWEILIEEK